MKKRSLKGIPRNLKPFVGRAVIVEWVDEIEADWTCFRLEAVQGEILSLSRMANEDGSHHDGSWVRARRCELKSMRLRF